MFLKKESILVTLLEKWYHLHFHSKQLQRGVTQLPINSLSSLKFSLKASVFFCFSGKKIISIKTGYLDVLDLFPVLSDPEFDYWWDEEKKTCDHRNRLIHSIETTTIQPDQ